MLPKIEIPSIDTGDFKFGKQTAEKIIVPTNKDELWNITKKYTGIEIPRVKVCENHDAPFDAFARAYFADVPIIVCIAARGLGGKSVLLAALGMIEAITLKTSVNLLGGSGEQSERIHNYMKGEEPNLSDRFWGWHEAPKYLLKSDPTKRDTKLTNGGIIRVLMASQRSVRGPHPTRLRCFSGNTKILTEAGYKAIMDINRGDVVYSYSGRFERDEVLQCGTVGVEPTIILELENGNELICTPDHYLLDSNHEWRQAVDFTLFELPKRVKMGAARKEKFHRFMYRVFPKGKGRKSGQVHRVWKKIKKRNIQSKKRGKEKAITLLGLPAKIIPHAKKMYRLRLRNRARCNQMPALSFQIEGGPKKPLCRLPTGVKTQIKKMPALSSEMDVRQRGCKIRGVKGNGNEKSKKRNQTGKNVFGIVRFIWFELRKTISNTQMDFGFLFKKGKNSNRGPWGILAQNGEAYRKRQQEKEILGISGLHSCISEESGISPLDIATCESIGVLSSRPGPTIPVWDIKVRNNRNVIAEGVIAHNCDEVDEMNFDIFKAALGQTMTSKGVKDQILLSSTHHKPLGTMTEILKMAQSRGFPIYRWCYKETQQAWLTTEMIDRKKATVFDAQWKIEYDLEAPTAEGTAIMAESVEKMFNKSLGSYKGNLGEYIEIEPPAAVCRDCNKQAVQTSFVSGTAPGGLACPQCKSTSVKPATYVNSADWAKERDFTDIMTIRTDVNPKKLVAYERIARLPWPNLIKRFDKRCNRYPGANVHDGIGIGNVIDDIMKTEAMPLELRGKIRRIVLSEYIVAIEDNEFVAPYIESVYNEHMHCTIDDLFGSGHLPDSVCAGALGNFGINRAGWARGMG